MVVFKTDWRKLIWEIVGTFCIVFPIFFIPKTLSQLCTIHYFFNKKTGILRYEYGLFNKHSESIDLAQIISINAERKFWSGSYITLSYINGLKTTLPYIANATEVADVLRKYSNRKNVMLHTQRTVTIKHV